ncbi:MAG: exodeoxyribonuclease VII large subunit [Mycobacteriaceae bacterium]
MTAPSSPEQPWPVRTVSMKVGQWIARLGAVWVEGQLTQVSQRPGTSFLVLRDPAADISLTLTCPSRVLAASPVPLTEGTRVIVHGQPDFYAGRGTFSLRITEIRAVGMGELLARLERLRQLLGAEGLFDPRRKRALPFLPSSVGLVTGRASAAERDVVSVATARWPAVRFVIRNTPVQGPTAVPAILAALTELDADATVQVIVLARGGGSVEDLLPFSDETLCRAIAACRTPVVSAVGHEPDSPLCDHVADVRAATPTDAAKRVVPDAAAEQALVDELHARSRAALSGWVVRESHRLDQLRSRPVLANPLRALDARQDEVARLLVGARREIRRTVADVERSTDALRSRLLTLGPAATLARGYAVVQRLDDVTHPVLRSVADALPGTPLRVRVSDGVVHAAVTDERES